MGSNLPPGVTASDIDRQYGGGHEHTFAEPDREIFEDGAFTVIHRCNHAPVVNSWTDSARDETYTKHGPRCKAEKYVRIDASSVSVAQSDGAWNTVAESDTNAFHDIVDGDTGLSVEDAENIESAIATATCDRATVMQHHADGVSIDCGPQERVVYIDGVTFDRLPDQMLRVTYDNMSTELRL